MSVSEKAARLVSLLVAAEKSGTHATVPPELVPADADEADAVQEDFATRLGPIVAFKVAHVGDGPGSWGAVPAPDVFCDGATVPTVRGAVRAEIEIAFRIGGDLPGRADGTPYDRADIEAAIDSALPLVEIIGERIPLEHDTPALLARADRLSNFGLVAGRPVADWRPFVRPQEYTAGLRIAGKPVVDGNFTHMSGVDPLYPVIWLANRLAQRSRGLKAGDIVTTGAFGGAHEIVVGQSAKAEIGGLGTLSFAVEKLEPASA